MAVAAEQLQSDYAHSLSTIKRSGLNPRLGSFVVSKLQPSSQEMFIENLAYDDFETAVIEMLKTDQEFRYKLDIDNNRSHQVVDGVTQAADGTPMIDIVRRAAAMSQGIAANQPEFRFQAVRDVCDVAVAEKVDELKPGQSWLGVSFDPKTAMSLHPEVYIDKLGYREGLLYIQLYSKIDDHTLIAGSYSIDGSDAQVLRQSLSEEGINIPENVTDDTWLMFGKEITAGLEEARALVLRIRTRCYQRRGQVADRLSVNEYVAQNRSLVQSLFNIYYQALSEALDSGHNNQVLQGLASSLLSKDISNLKPELRQRLMRIANSSLISEDDGKVLDSVLRYSVAEQLRKGLKSIMTVTTMTSSINFNQPINYPVHIPMGYLNDINQVHNLMSGNVQTGIKARRSYGGCSGQIELSSGVHLESDHKSSLQEAFGGLNGRDKLGKRAFRCANGHLNIRPYNEKIPVCQHKGCKAKVACHMQE